MFELEVSGLEEIIGKLGDLRRKIKALEAEGMLLAEFFPVDFLRKHTDFESLEDMLQASGFVVESPEDFKKIPEGEWDSFVKGHTQFSNWSEMLSAAGKEWVERNLAL